MARTEYARWNAAKDLYCKPLPLANPWTGDIVAFTESAIDPGSYASGMLAEQTQYEVFEAASGAGNEAATDLAIGAIGVLAIAEVSVTPVQGLLSGSLSGTTNVTIYQDETKSLSIGVTDIDGNAVDVSGMTLEIVIEDIEGNDIATIVDGSITKVTSTVTFEIPPAASAKVGDYQWSLRRSAGNAVLMHGVWTVKYAADND